MKLNKSFYSDLKSPFLSYQIVDESANSALIYMFHVNKDTSSALIGPWDNG
jgi:hypothetical protein